MTDRAVGVRELKARLSEYLREVQRGQTIVITDHGRPVGRLMPAGASLRQKMDALQQAGVVTWNGEKAPPVKPAAVWRGPRSSAEMIGEDRE